MLKNKTTIVTGCNRGIGFEILKLFSKNGSNIIACVRKKNEQFENELKNFSKKYKTTIRLFYFDMNNEDEIIKASKEIISLDTNIDILINNAGIVENRLFQMMSMKKTKQLFQVNLFGPLLFTQYIIKKMLRQKKGNIINIASSAAFDPNIGRAAYSSSKSALITAFDVISRELSPYIKINNIAPGLIDTDMMHDSTSKNNIENYLNRLNIKRVGQVMDVASVALFLSSDMSSYINAQTIKVDGGLK